MSKELTKTVKLSISTWKKLAQIKLDSGADSFEEVVKELIDIKGGY